MLWQLVYVVTKCFHFVMTWHVAPIKQAIIYFSCNQDLQWTSRHDIHEYRCPYCLPSWTVHTHTYILTIFLFWVVTWIFNNFASLLIASVNDVISLCSCFVWVNIWCKVMFLFTIGRQNNFQERSNKIFCFCIVIFFRLTATITWKYALGYNMRIYLPSSGRTYRWWHGCGHCPERRTAWLFLEVLTLVHLTDGGERLEHTHTHTLNYVFQMPRSAELLDCTWNVSNV